MLESPINNRRQDAMLPHIRKFGNTVKIDKESA